MPNLPRRRTGGPAGGAFRGFRLGGTSPGKTDDDHHDYYESSHYAYSESTPADMGARPPWGGAERRPSAPGPVE
eukprot:5069568-Alexandrium_andersonii.AAC.1